MSSYLIDLNEAQADLHDLARELAREAELGEVVMFLDSTEAKLRFGEEIDDAEVLRNGEVLLRLVAGAR